MASLKPILYYLMDIDRNITLDYRWWHENYCFYLRTWSLLLSSEESVEGDVGDLADLESDSGNISDSVTFTSESRNQNFVVLFNEVQTTVIGDESCDLLSVLDELNSDTLPDGRVRLLSLNTNLLKNNSLKWTSKVKMRNFKMEYSFFIFTDLNT